jgi:hypothetical protein
MNTDEHGFLEVILLEATVILSKRHHARDSSAFIRVHPCSKAVPKNV